MLEIRQKVEIVIPAEDIRNTYWSIPYWEELGDAKSEANKGLLRHNVNGKPIDFVPPEFKVPYPLHVKKYLETIDDPTGSAEHTLLVLGTRNTFQNLGLPGFHVGRRPVLLSRPDEPWQNWIYHGLSLFNDGKKEILAVKYEGTDGSTKPDRAKIVSREQQGDEDIVCVIPGQPILWDGEVPPIQQLAACTYDLRHIWHLLWERWQNHEPHETVHNALMEAFMRYLREPLQDRAEALASIAAREGLAETDSYLHSSVGLTDDGSLVLIMMNGSLRDLGLAQKNLGAVRAILLDNGGSVGVACYSARAWATGDWGSKQEYPSPTSYIGNGTYFRPRGHSVLIVELKEDITEGPFRVRPSAHTAWTGISLP